MVDYPGEYRLIEPGMMDSLVSKGLDYLTTDNFENYEKDAKLSDIWISPLQDTTYLM
ncbi:MAG: hypothetical protein IPG53_06485 [Ignavibacteriales bacterium]|nr:hypothetical protein [Ignavibacteriales bacterium]